MRFVAINGFSIRLDRQVEFQKWLSANEERIKASYTKGSEYGGVYAAVFSSEKGAGDYFWLDIYDSYGALDIGAAVAKDPSSELAKVNEEFVAFLDPDRSAPWSKILLKAVGDATVMDLPTA